MGRFLEISDGSKYFERFYETNIHTLILQISLAIHWYQDYVLGNLSSLQQNMSEQLNILIGVCVTCVHSPLFDRSLVVYRIDYLSTLYSIDH